ncbi:type II toxin-antitoxin system RelE/ParE family toxin [Treponema saccharophilum]|uniref:type II toxin-antitoxin system RelE/ParE family toxin n=1 Tax=Treponema saccharophilum TaxID=165 RepID=UPI001FE0E74E
MWAFKPKPDRFLSFFTSGKRIIITNAFEKKCQKLPPAEKEKTEKCRAIMKPV